MGDRDEGKRRRLEGVIPEIIKRAVEVGVGKAQDAPQNIKTFIHDLKVPKEIAGYIFSQVDETKNGLFRVVAKEMRDFLEHTNVAGEMQKLLTTVQFEINTTIRFRPNEPGSPASGDEGEGAGKLSKPEVKTEVHMSRAQRREKKRREKAPRNSERDLSREARDESVPDLGGGSEPGDGGGIIGGES